MASYISGANLMSVASAPEASVEAVWDTYALGASRLFDLLCEVEADFFAAIASGATATERTFYPENIDMFRLPPFVVNSIAEVLIDDEEIDDDAWRVKGAPGAQYLINLDGDFDEDKAITVTAIWGFAAVLPEIKTVCTELGIWLWRLKDPLFSQNSQTEIYEKLSPTTNAVIKKFRDKYNQSAY